SFRGVVFGPHYRKHRDRDPELAGRSSAAHGLSFRHLVRSRARGRNVVPGNAVEAAAAGVRRLAILDRTDGEPRDLRVSSRARYPCSSFFSFYFETHHLSFRV